MDKTIHNTAPGLVPNVTYKNLTFSNLIFSFDSDTGYHRASAFFRNRYGVSVIRLQGSKFYELAVLVDGDLDGETFETIHQQSITDIMIEVQSYFHPEDYRLEQFEGTNELK